MQLVWHAITNINALPIQITQVAWKLPTMYMYTCIKYVVSVLYGKIAISYNKRNKQRIHSINLIEGVGSQTLARGTGKSVTYTKLVAHYVLCNSK